MENDLEGSLHPKQKPTSGVAEEGGAIDERYYNEQIKVVDEQLALAGLRLAAILNDVFGQASPQEFRRAEKATGN